MAVSNPRDPNFHEHLVGHCEYCGEELTTAYPIYRDDCGYLFCSEKCAAASHGIEEVMDDFDNYYEEDE